MNWKDIHMNLITKFQNTWNKRTLKTHKEMKQVTHKGSGLY